MSAESLSPNQVANLRRAMELAHESEVVDADKCQPAAARAAQAAIRSSESARQLGTHAGGSTSSPNAVVPKVGSRSGGAAHGPPATAYDFKHPDRMGKEQLQFLWSLHESIARDFASSFSRLLRTPLNVRLLSVDQVACCEFVSSREKPSCLGVITPAPLDGNWMLDIDPSLAFAIIDRLLGGDPVPDESIRRPLTEIENRLMSRVVTLFLEQTVPAWANIVTLQPKLKSIESTPHRVPIALPDEAVIQVGFEVRWGENCGRMTLCIPAQSIEKYRDKLSQQGSKDLGSPNATEKSRRQIAENIDAANVNVVVTLARSRIKTSDLMGLSVGDIITTDQNIDRPLEMTIQDIPKFNASAGAYKGKKAVQIQSIIEPQ